MYIINQARLDYDIEYPHSHYPIHNTKFSNEVCTIITDDILLISKEVDKKTASIFDLLTYIVTIKNLTQAVLSNLWFMDCLSPDLKFVPGSVCIKGKTERCFNPQKGFQIPILPPCGITTIIFSAVICHAPDGKQIKNCAKVKLDFNASPLSHPIPITFKSNQTSTRIVNHLFKQLNVGALIPVPGDFLKTHKVAKVTTYIRVIDSKIVKSPVTRLPSYPDMPVLLLLVTGCIDVEVKYQLDSPAQLHCDYCNLKRKSDRQSIISHGFSEYMFVPAGIQYCPEKIIRFQIEEMIYHTSEKDIFINLCALMSLQTNS